MTTSPSKEDPAAYEAAVGAAHTLLDEVRNGIDEARDEIEKAKDEARRIFDPSTAASIFNGALADVDLAARTIADAVDGLPALDEGHSEEEGSASETNS